MSGTNWTPGPWNVVLDRDDETAIWSVSVEDAKGVVVWFCAGFPPHETDEIIANAHVTAAALDLYAACEKTMPWLEAMGYSGSHVHGLIAAALKKARGEQ